MFCFYHLRRSCLSFSLSLFLSSQLAEHVAFVCNAIVIVPDLYNGDDLSATALSAASAASASAAARTAAVTSGPRANAAPRRRGRPKRDTTRATFAAETATGANSATATARTSTTAAALSPEAAWAAWAARHPPSAAAVQACLTLCGRHYNGTSWALVGVGGGGGAVLEACLRAAPAGSSSPPKLPIAAAVAICPTNYVLPNEVRYIGTGMCSTLFEFIT